MSSERRIAANRSNSRKSCGPRTAAGKAKASRNALRHGLAAITHRLPAPSAESKRFAKAICGEDSDPAMFAQALIIAENEMVLRAIRAQRVAVVERLREKTAIALAKGDNSLRLAKARLKESKRAYAELVALLPIVLEKYKDQLPVKMHEATCELVPLDVKLLLQYNEQLEPESETIALDRYCSEFERDEFEAMEVGAPDLIRLDRYERRIWSRQKRAFRDFQKMKLAPALTDPPAAPPKQ